MAKPIEVDGLWAERILEQVNGLAYGSVLITVHDGRIVQIERTERKRFDANAGAGTNVQSTRYQVAGRSASGPQSHL